MQKNANVHVSGLEIGMKLKSMLETWEACLGFSHKRVAMVSMSSHIYKKEVGEVAFSPLLPALLTFLVYFDFFSPWKSRHSYKQSTGLHCLHSSFL